MGAHGPLVDGDERRGDADGGRREIQGREVEVNAGQLDSLADQVGGDVTSGELTGRRVNFVVRFCKASELGVGCAVGFGVVEAALIGERGP